MPDYLNLSGPQLGDLGVGGAPARPVTPPTAYAPPISEPPPAPPDAAHQEPGSEAMVSGNLNAALGNALDPLEKPAVPLSRDVLALEARSQQQAPADVLASLNGAPTNQLADLEPAALGPVDLQQAVAQQTPVQGDRMAYQARYEQATDILNLQNTAPDVAAELDHMPDVALQQSPVAMNQPVGAPASEAKKLDRLVSLMAQGVDIGHIDAAALETTHGVANQAAVSSLSQEPYSNLGHGGLPASMSALGDDPAAPIADLLRGNVS
jgi:hypothetical protein